MIFNDTQHHSHLISFKLQVGLYIDPYFNRQIYMTEQIEQRQPTHNISTYIKKIKKLCKPVPNETSFCLIMALALKNM